MNDKDLILKTMISNPNRNPNSIFTPDSLIKSDILKGKNEDEIEFLIKQIIKEKPELLRIEKVLDLPLAVNPTKLVDSFLKNGGFNKIESELKEKKDIEFRKTKVDLQLAEKMLEEYPKTKWFARIGFIIGICLAVLELLKFLIPIMFPSDKT